jgi:hypothetical protein
LVGRIKGFNVHVGSKSKSILIFILDHNSFIEVEIKKKRKALVPSL